MPRVGNAPPTPPLSCEFALHLLSASGTDACLAGLVATVGGGVAVIGGSEKVVGLSIWALGVGQGSVVLS
jgi:hypothetical protein